jgi:hypothetical protein
MVLPRFFEGKLDSLLKYKSSNFTLEVIMFWNWLDWQCSASWPKGYPAMSWTEAFYMDAADIYGWG